MRVTTNMNLLDMLALDTSRADNLYAVVAEVTGVSGRTVTVLVNGGSVAGVPVAKCYATPTQGEAALVVKLGSSWLALTALG